MCVERERIEHIKGVQRRLEDARHELDVAQRQGQFDVASRLRFATIPDLEKQLPQDGTSNGEGVMLHERVTGEDVARVVAKATGIPVQNLMRGEKEKLVHVSNSCVTMNRHLTNLVDGGDVTKPGCWTGSGRPGS